MTAAGISAKRNRPRTKSARSGKGSAAASARSATRRVVRALATAVLVPPLVSVAAVGLLRIFPPPTTSFVVQWRLAHAAVPQRKWTPWDDLSPYVPLAFVAAEDQKFPQHRGFDVEAIGNAIEERRTSGRVRGASTITQQVAKNVFLWPERSWLRKGLEVWLTVWIELLWPKQRILEMYVNVAQLGPGVFGAEAAARAYFGKSAGALTADEAAQLAAVLPDPDRLSARRPSAYVLERRAWILTQMRALGGTRYISELDS
jgi:monofunctional biosynthetic peptidoglycan transglycosylase